MTCVWLFFRRHLVSNFTVLDAYAFQTCEDKVGVSKKKNQIERKTNYLDFCALKALINTTSASMLSWVVQPFFMFCITHIRYLQIPSVKHLFGHNFRRRIVFENNFITRLSHLLCSQHLSEFPWHWNINSFWCSTFLMSTSILPVFYEATLRHWSKSSNILS